MDRRTRPVTWLPALPMESTQNKGEAYRKALKTKLRAAVPRSLRKTVFRIAGLEDPLTQLDSQKLRELEKLDTFLKTHFPEEMATEPVSVPRDKLRALADQLNLEMFGPGARVAPVQTKYTSTFTVDFCVDHVLSECAARLCPAHQPKIAFECLSVCVPLS